MTENIMSNSELPTETMDLPEARILWASSFLVDWLVPLLHDNRIEKPSEVVQLYEEFLPLLDKGDKGTDFTINDVLVAAIQWQTYNEKLHPHFPVKKLPNGKAFLKAIKLLTKAVHSSEQSEHWIQTSFLSE